MLSLAGTASAELAVAAEENDYYRLISIATPRAQTDSRSKTWKPAVACLGEGELFRVKGEMRFLLKPYGFGFRGCQLRESL